MKGQVNLPALVLAVLFIGSAVILSSPNQGLPSITGRDVFIAAVPLVNNVILNSTFGTNETNENLTVYWNSTDPDSDPVINITDWRKNGNSIALLNMPFENRSDSASATTDYSTNSFNGTVDSSVKFANGLFGGAYNFSLTGSNAPTGAITLPNVPLTNRFTITMWIFPIPSSDFFGTLISEDDVKGIWYRGTSQRIDFFYDGGHTTAATLTENQWNHVVVRNTNGNVDFYINGVLDSNTYTYGPAFNANNIGNDPSSETFKGLIDELRVYNRSLSTEQILALYNNRTDLIVSQETGFNETWQACITPNDRKDDGTTVCSNNLIVDPNNLPIISNVIINSTFGTNGTNENLTVYFNATDADGDNITNITDWRIDGSSMALVNMPFENHPDAAFTAKDYSTFANEGSVIGATWTSNGFRGGAYTFDGVDDYINLSTIIKTNKFTYGGWVFFDTLSCTAGFCIPFHQDEPSGFTGLELFLETANSKAACWDGTTQSPTSASAPVLSSGVWYNLLCVHNGTHFALYLNGVLQGTPVASTGTPPALDFIIGGGDEGTSGQWGFEGRIDQAMVFNRSISGEQILALYNNRTDLIVSQETEILETWQACITPNDRKDDGAVVCSNNLSIRDTVPPVISNVVEGVSNESAIVQWDTDENANSSVNFGTMLSLGTKTGNSSSITSHSVTLIGLNNNTLYFYNITSCDISGNCAVNGTFNFTTVQNQGAPVITNLLLFTVPNNKNKTNENLTINITVTDAENDPVINITDWRLNGNSIAVLNMPFENNYFFNLNVKDYSTYGNNGTVVDAVFNSTGGHNGFGAYTFNSSLMNRIQIPNSPSLELNTSFTITHWVNVRDITTSSPGAIVASLAGPTTTYYKYGTRIGDTDRFLFFSSAFSPSTVFFGAISTNTWLHLAAVYNSTANTIKLYQNGVQVGGDTVSGTISYSVHPDLFIGGGPSGNFTLNGTIDDVRIYNRALNAEQLLALYNNRTDLIVSQELNQSGGENWSVAVTPNDRTKDGATVLSNTITLIEGVSPIISSFNYAVTNESINITWNTDETTNTSVNFGITSSLGTKFNNPANVTSHNVFIDALTSNTTYFFNATSCDFVDNCDIEGTINFTTLPNTGCVTPIQGELHYIGRFTFCPGTFNFDGNGFTIKNSYVEMICDGTILNGTGGGAGVIISSLNNITMNGCAFKSFSTGAHIVRTGFVDSNNIRLDNNTFISNTLAINIFGGTTFNLNKNFINCSGGDGIRFDVDDTQDINIIDNTIINCAEGIKTTCTSFGACIGTNQITIINNTLASNTFGIVTSANSAPGVQGGTISGNNFSNSQFGVYMPSGGSGLLLTRNMFANSSASDVFWSQSNTLILNAGDNEISITNTVLNMTNQGNNIFIGPKIAAINTTAEPGLNLSADLTFVGLTSTATPDVFLFSGFSNDTDFVIANGAICPASICTAINYSVSAGILNVTVAHFSSYAVKENFVAAGGGGGGGLSAPSVIQPPAPVIEAPLALQINNFACLESASIKATSDTKTLEEYVMNLKNNFQIIVPPFSLDCKNASSSLTLAVPDSYSNVTAIKCLGPDCNLLQIAQTRTVRCAQNFFEDVRRTTTILSPDSFPIELVAVEGQPGQDVLESSKTKIKFIGNVGKVLLNKLLGPAKEPVNQRIRIVGTPTVLTFEGITAGLSTDITLPYVVPAHVDEFSTAVFAYKSNQWNYIGGIVDANSKTVTATINDVSKYIENGKLTVAPLGLICLNCIDAKLEKVYQGYSRDAVVLIHGFENTPERFNDILNDIKLTNQPWQAWVFGYSSSKPIDENAKVLADLLQANANEFDTIYIAAHSLGGLVAQQALNYANEQNKINAIKPYTFLSKVVKVISVATPNKGILTQDPSNLFNYLVNNDAIAGLFNLNSEVIKELISGREIPRVPGIDYLVIAGTSPYSFSEILGITEKNDGFVTLSSAQNVGGELVSNYCSDFWTINETHTGILNNYDSRKIVERIVAREIAKSLPNKPVLGFNSYYDLNVYSCNPSDQFVIIGIPLKDEAKPNPGLCSCGNNVCGIDENEVNCPSDCARIEMPEAGLLALLLRFAPLRNLLIALLLIIIAVILLSRHKRKPSKKMGELKVTLPKELPENASDSARANLLDELIVQTRVNMRLNNYDKAAVFYSRFHKEYAIASSSVKERFKEDMEKLRSEVKGKLK